MTPRSLHIAHELALQGEDWEGLCELFGMHMAFDEEDGRVLEGRVEGFGWNIVQREHPEEYAKLGTHDEDERLLEAVVTMADDYKGQLLRRLAAHWIMEN